MRTLLCLTLILFAMPISASALDVTITVNSISTAEARAANWYLANVVNPQREAAGESTFANPRDYVEWTIENSLVQSWIDHEALATREQQDVAELWRNADDTQRAAALAALQGSMVLGGWLCWLGFRRRRLN